MSNQILHLSHDDKFIDLMIDEFDKLSTCENKYAIYTAPNVKELTHIKNPKVQFAEKDTLEFDQLIGDLNSYKAIFIHYAGPFLCKKILEAGPQVKIFMIFWGSEVFKLPEFYKESLAPATEAIMKKITPINKFKFAFKPKNLKLEINKYRAIKADEILKEKAYERVDYFCHWIPEDYSYIKSKIKMHAQFMDYIYGTLEGIAGAFYNTPFPELGNEMIIGNSANETNNHLDLFQTLKSIKLPVTRVNIPLSYGEPNKDYVNYIKESAQNTFLEKSNPLIDFMHRDEYYEMLNRCEFAFMNHIRSQGGALNRFLLYQGKKLFMNEQSNMYKFYKNSGLIVFSIQDELCAQNENLWKPLSNNEKEHNRRVLDKVFGITAVRSRYRHIIETIERAE